MTLRYATPLPSGRAERLSIGADAASATGAGCGTLIAGAPDMHRPCSPRSLSKRYALPAAASFVFALALAAPTDAQAAIRGLEACGDIDVRGDARCELVAQGGCTARCEPVTLRAACAAKLTAQCSGECSARATADCTGSCTADCRGRCEANGGQLDCQGSCTGSCDADCNGRCGSSSDGETCRASCRANCTAKCDAKCSATPPTATCEGKCEASCSGSCDAKASAECQVDCQAKLQASCTAELEGGCRARCEKPEGALFCDGQFVDTGDVQRCIDALRAVLNVQVSGSASGECSNGQCTGEAEGSVSCTASRTRRELPPPPPIVPMFVVLAAIGAIIVRKNRRGGP